MNQQSGRSLIEVIGVMAIMGLMTVAALGMFQVMRANQKRTIANAELEQIAENTKLLLEMRDDYTGVSVDYLIKAGALQSDRAPIGGENWSVTSSVDGTSFSINLVDLTTGECDYFSTAKPQWTTKILVNGYKTGYAENCFKSDTNKISFIVE